MFQSFLSFFSRKFSSLVHCYQPSTIRSHGWGWRLGLISGSICTVIIGLMIWSSSTPAPVSAHQAIKAYALPQHLDSNGNPKNIKTGAALTAMTTHILDTLIHKNGGYTRNDILPPGILMDNMPEWEYGVLRNIRDLSKVFRNNFSTSGSQTKLDHDLGEVENKLSIDSTRWALPQPEDAYNDASKALRRYFDRIMDENDNDAQFYARADNLRRYLNIVSPNLGSYSQRLSESVGKTTENMGLAGESAAQQSTLANSQLFNKTPWYKVDNTFFEARGYTWALLQEVRAIRLDFKEVLKDKNATVYIDQLVRELEATQSTIWSPVILNGSGFGLVTNHSLVMASYLSRANSIIIELSTLLERG